MDLGPVLDLQDVAGGKICALASRIEPRDYLDTAAMLTRYTPDELISLARQLDPGLEHRDFAEAGQRLDQMPDTGFTALGLSTRDITSIRDQFANWLEQAGAVIPRRPDGSVPFGIEISPLFALDAAELKSKVEPGMVVERPIYLR